MGAFDLPVFRLQCGAGLFMAPPMVGEAIKGGMLLTKVLSERGRDVLSPCVVHTDPCEASGRSEQMGAKPDNLCPPGVAVCMGDEESMRAMIRAVESNVCMPAGQSPPAQILVTTGGITGARAQSTNSGGKQLSVGAKPVGSLKVHPCRSACM